MYVCSILEYKRAFVCELFATVLCELQDSATFFCENPHENAIKMRTGQCSANEEEGMHKIQIQVFDVRASAPL